MVAGEAAAGPAAASSAAAATLEARVAGVSGPLKADAAVWTAAAMRAMEERTVVAWAARAARADTTADATAKAVPSAVGAGLLCT
jgi:hypothetical protein